VLDARFTNRRHGCEWYTCARCGVDYPRTAVSVRNGLVLCHGPNSNACGEDQPGHAAALRQLNLPFEVAIPPLDEETIDL
jgi:hypothetical protein